MNRQALREYLADAAQRKQKFGSYDCVRFVAECLLVGWDKDHLAKLEYWDRRSAVRRLRKAGGLRFACSEALGPEIQDLREGDIAYYDDPATIGIIVKDRVLVFMGNTIWRLPIETALTGWRC